MNPLRKEVFESDYSPAGLALRKAGLTGNTPLWYYILKEAEHNGAQHLGRLGSRIVQGTIEEVLQNDRRSYLAEKGAKWKLPSWKFPGAQAARGPVATIPALIRLVGEDEPLSGCTPLQHSTFKADCQLVA